MPWTTPPGAYGSADPLFLLLLALAIEAYIGDRPILGRWTRAPRRAAAALAHGLDRRLNRPQRGPGALRVRGWIAVLFIALVAFALGWLVTLFTRHYPFGWILEVLLLVTVVAQRSSWLRAKAVADALEGGGLVAAREALRRLPAERIDAAELERLDGRGLAMGALAGVASRLAGDLVAPTFWYVALGLPGVFLQQAIRIAAAAPKADRRAGGGRYGAAALRCDRVLFILPDWIAALLVALAAVFVPHCKPGIAFDALPGGRDRTETALAAALGVAGEADGTPHRPLLGRALFLFPVACLINAGLVAGLAMLRLGL